MSITYRLMTTTNLNALVTDLIKRPVIRNNHIFGISDPDLSI